MPTIAFNEDLQLPLAREAAWAALLDASLWRASLPADAALEPDADPRAFQLRLGDAQVRLLPLDVEPPGRWRLHVDGASQRHGSVDGQALIRLERLGEHRTLLHVAVVLQLPQVPLGLQRAAGHALKARLAAWADGVHRALALDVPMPGRQPPKPWPQRLLDWYLGWFAGIFNGTLFPPPQPRPRRSGRQQSKGSTPGQAAASTPVPPSSGLRGD